MNYKSKYSSVYFQTWIDAATYASLAILHLDEEYNTSHSKKFSLSLFRKEDLISWWETPGRLFSA